jgi:hypothetical protein
MKLRTIYTFTVLVAMTLFSMSCKKSEDVIPTGVGSLEIEFDNVAGNSELILNSTYKNAQNEDLKISTFKYFISNIKLKKADGTVFVYPQDDSYFLIDEENEASQLVKLKNIPSADYTEISFVVGVDSLRSVSDVSKRTGTLDPATTAAGMYWSWNSGYIFVKCEGTSPQIASTPTNPDRNFYYHIGFFGGKDSQTLNNLKTVTLPIASKASVRTNVTPEIHLLVDALKLFNGTTNIKLSDYPVVMTSAYSANVANNYLGMFVVDHVHN